MVRAHGRRAGISRVDSLEADEISLGDDSEWKLGDDDDFVMDLDSSSGDLLIRDSGGTVKYRFKTSGELEVNEDAIITQFGEVSGESGNAGLVGFSSGGSDNTFLMDRDANRQLSVDRGGPINFKGNILENLSTNDTDNSMTANPESDAESGFFEIDVGGTTRQVPFYDA